MLSDDQISAICARHAATIGMSGSGKTFTEKGYVEWLLRQKRHTVIIDPLGAWWGLRSSVDGDGDGFPIVIFGGEHGDLEIGPWDGAAVAEIVLRDIVTCIIDLSGFRNGADQRIFMEGFIGGLRGKPKGTLNLIVDEADEFAPETVQDKVGNRLKEDMVWIAKRGRMSGFILHIITQRPADIAKSVLTQCQSLTVHQLIAPQDQKPAEDWLKGNGDKAVTKSVMESLAGLETGERWVYCPKHRILDRGTSPAITTFDSSRTPEPGETIVEAKTLAQLDVSAIKGALAKAPEDVAPEAKSEELEVAHVRIEDLEAQLEGERAASAHQAEAVKQEVGIIGLTIAELNQRFSALEALVDNPPVLITESPPCQSMAVPPIVPSVVAQAREMVETSRREHGADRLRDFDQAREAIEEVTERALTDASMNPTAAAFADMLDRIAPASVTWANLCSMTGRKPRGGNFNTAKKQLLASGRAREQGGKVISSRPARSGMNRGAAMQLWRGVLVAMRGCAKAPEIFDLLAERELLPNASGMTKDEIGETLGMATRGGNWNTNWSALRNNDLLTEVSPGKFRLAHKLPGER